jgi:hypothetical protein
MGGVGSFNRQNRTLYVGRIKENGGGQDTEEVVYRHFKEFGQIEKGMAFFEITGKRLMTKQTNQDVPGMQ